MTGPGRGGGPGGRAEGAGPPAYELRGVSVRKGDRTLLDVPALTIERGALVAVVGPNGAGKTRLLRVLSLLEGSARGTVRFFGRTVRIGPAVPLEILRRVAMVDQTPYLFRTSVLSNVSCGLRWRGVPPAEARARGAAALERVGLGGLARRAAATLSGGERGRVALARVLAVQPDVLLLDETSAHVDAPSRLMIEGIVRRCTAEEGRTVVLATHDLGEAYRLGARVLSLHRGRPVEAPPDNIFAAEIVGDEAGVKRARLDGGPELSVATPVRGRASVAIDARAVILSRGPIDSSARNSLRARVVAVSMAGEVVQVTVDAGVELVALVTMESFRDLGIRLGDEVSATFKSTAVRVFG